MRSIFKQLITDFHSSQVPEPCPRELNIPFFPIDVRKAYVFVGMRRSGKTWAMYQTMNELLKREIRLEQILYINFADDRLFNMKSEDFQSILDAYFELYPQYINSPDLYFFLDEIHKIKNWEQFIRRLLDTEKMAIYISGSSAKMLSTEIATSLRGRAIVREIFPFSFYEYLSCRNIAVPKQKSSKQLAEINHHLQHYLLYGGFPEAVKLFAHSMFSAKLPIRLLSNLNMLRQEFRELLQSYIEGVVSRDIVDRYKITNHQAVRRLLLYCLQNSKTTLSIHKIYNDWKSQGYEISKNSLYDFREYFEEAYCVFNVPMYSLSTRESSNRDKKVYPVDTGLITAYTIKEDSEASARLETAVFLKLRRSNKRIFYYKTDIQKNEKLGKEVDFLTLSSEGQLALYQVTQSIKDEKTFQRGKSALERAMGELKLNSGIIVVLDGNEQKIKVSTGNIHCLPLWKFLLDVQ